MRDIILQELRRCRQAIEKITDPKERALEELLAEYRQGKHKVVNQSWKKA